MKGYKKYKPTGIDWIGEIPEHWKVERIKDTLELHNEKRTPLSSDERALLEKRIYTQLEDAEKTKFTEKLRTKLDKKIPDKDEKKKFINLLNKLVSTFYFLSKFFEIEKEIIEYCIFIDAIKDTLLEKTGSRMKELLQHLYVERGAVRREGEKINPKAEYKPTETPRGAGGTPEINRITIPSMLEELKDRFQITEEEAIVLSDITMELEEDSSVIEVVRANKGNELFLFGSFIKDVIQKIKEKFYDKDMDDRLALDSYAGEGGIISLMARNIIQKLQLVN